MKKSYITIVSALAAMAAVLFVPGSALTGTNPNTDDPSGWGKFTSGAATTDGRAFGDHASNPPFDVTPDQPGRTGLGNILQAVTNDPDASKHPSELGEALCSAPNANTMAYPLC